MDYFSVIVLVIVTFVFISDRNVKSIENIIEENTNMDIYMEIEKIKKKLHIISIDTKAMNYRNILDIAQKSQSEYILLINNELVLNEEQKDILISNYLVCNKIPCGFNLLYVYEDKKWSLKKLYLDIINYLNIFNKNDLSTYGAIICKKEDLEQNERKFKNNLLSYTPNKFTYIFFNREDIKSQKIKTIYINKISEANIDIIIKIFLLIISGSIITTNLLYSVFNITNNISGLVVSLVIYYCYSYIIRYIYKPIGKQRLLATYIFPIYFISYIIIGIYTLCLRRIKKVQAS